MKRSCPGSSLVMRAGFTVTTLRQSDNPASGKAPSHQGQKKARQVKNNLKSMIITSFDIKGIMHKEFVQARLQIPGSAAKFCGDCVKMCKEIAPNFGENRPGCFTMTTPRFTLPSSPNSFCEKQNCCYPPPTTLP